MKDFQAFEHKMTHDSVHKMNLERRLHRELASVPALSLMGRDSVNKLVHTISDISLDICLSTLKAYHQWREER